MQNTLSLQIDEESVRQLAETLVKQILEAMSWPPGRLALTEAEAAEATGVGRHVLRDLRQAGKLSCTKVGKRYLYRRSDLMELLDRHANQNPGGQL